MSSHIIKSRSISLVLLDTVQFSGIAANVLLAAGAGLFTKPALDSLLMSGSPISPVTVLSERIGELTLLDPAAKRYSHHNIVTPFVTTTKLVPSFVPLLQPSMTAGVMFGIAACLLSLVAAGTLLVRTHAGSQCGTPSSPPPSRSLSETLAYNREQRQGQNGRNIRLRRSGRQPPNPNPPNNNHNNIPTQDVKPSRSKNRPQVKAGIAAPPPPPPPPPPPVAVHADKAGKKAGKNTLWKCVFGLAVMALIIKYTSTFKRLCSQSDDTVVDSLDTPSLPPDVLGPMELQHSSVASRSPLGPLLARLQVVYKTAYSFVLTVFTSPCLFLRLATGCVLCTLLCWILSSICALASGSACTGVHQVEAERPCEDVPTPEDQLEDLGNPEQVLNTPNPVEDIVVVLPSGPPSVEEPAERRVPPPGRTRRTRPRRHPSRPPHNHTLEVDKPV